MHRKIAAWLGSTAFIVVIIIVTTFYTPTIKQRANIIDYCSKRTVYVNYPGVWSGSGVIISKNMVLTAGHVVDGATELEITTYSGKVYRAIGWHNSSIDDCGIIVILGEFDYIAEFADSVKVGDKVICVGSPYGDILFNTVTLGIISGIDRGIEYFGSGSVITTDADVNPGCSGGPVFNTQGEVIGIIVGTMGNVSIIVPASACKGLINGKQENRIRDKETELSFSR